MTTTKRVGMLVIICFLCLARTAIAEVPVVQWIQQIGTADLDIGTDVAADGFGHVYVTGYTFGNLAAQNAGQYDIFLSKFDYAGNRIWARQLGSSSFDTSASLATDKHGYVYIAGATQGRLGSRYFGLDDAFVSKFDPLGNLIWTQQLGTPATDQATAVSVDAFGGVYISGYTTGGLAGVGDGTNDPFVSKFDEAGKPQWTRQLDFEGESQSFGVSTDYQGNVYLTGYANEEDDFDEGTNAFVSKYDTDGNSLWTRHLGISSNSRSEVGIATVNDTNGNVYVSGRTRRNDIFIFKYNAGGNIIWHREFGTSQVEENHGLAIDDSGNIYLSGHTEGVFGEMSHDSIDAFVLKYDVDGNFAWMHQLGSVEVDFGHGISTDGIGSIFLTGWTHGDFGGPNFGGSDTFLVRLVEGQTVPEPNSLLLATVPLVVIALRKLIPGSPLSQND